MLTCDYVRALCRMVTGYLAITIWTAGVDAVRCFCDKRTCQDALMCDGEWCLVGFKSDVRLDQICGSADSEVLSDCKEKWNGWEEVCACQHDFCNTFSFLRKHMERIKANSRRNLYDNNGEQLSPNVHDPDQHMNRPHQYQSNQLIILLVVVPLSVGAAAVCLVFLNYHCKMC